MKHFYLFFIFILFGCATSPTGRKQLVLVSDSKINQMGKMSFEQLKKEGKLSYDARKKRYINCIVNNLIPHVNSNIRKWEVEVFKDKSANAFALPGGYIGVHTGMLDVAKNQGQLAAVIGHEIGHVTAKHGAEKVSSAMAAQFGLMGLQILTTGDEGQNALLFGAQVLTQVTVLLPHGRSQESESDHIGLMLMAKAGFDPRQSVELWKNMQKAHGGGPPQFLSTHPSNKNRIKNLNKLMPKAMAYFNSSSSRPTCRL